MKAVVSFLATATHYVTVEIPDDTPEDERFNAAVAEAVKTGAPGLCHQCARRWDLGQEEVPEPNTRPYNFTAHDIVRFEE